MKLDKLSCSIALIQSCFAFFCLGFPSRETLSISKFDFLYFSFNLTSFGFSILHGLHHDAQKSIKTTFPLSSESEIKLLLTSGNVKSGAGCPNANGFAISICCCNKSI